MCGLKGVAMCMLFMEKIELVLSAHVHTDRQRLRASHLLYGETEKSVKKMSLIFPLITPLFHFQIVFSFAPFKAVTASPTQKIAIFIENFMKFW